MEKYLIIFSILIFSVCAFGQSNSIELDEWIKKSEVTFNSPSTPIGFNHFINCDEIHAFKKVIGDTIILYSRGSSIAENLETLKKSALKKDFNTYRYLTFIQKNGTIIVQNLRKRLFLKKNNSLYLLDEHNDKRTKIGIKLANDFFKKKISKEKYIQQIKAIEKMNFAFKPKFKLIYFEGIFNDTNNYVFKKNQNFREEKVTLVRTWLENGKKYYEIELKTNTAGKFIFSEDFSFINTEKCGENLGNVPN